MLERANDPKFRAIAEPNQHALQLLDRVLAETSDPLVTEIGIGVGATSRALGERLAGRGRIHFYDFDEKLAELGADLAGLGITNTDFFPNSRRTYDSYAWTLALRMREQRGSQPELYDLAFLDGAHAFHHDAAATAILKEMIKPGGFLLFDDFDWSFAISPTMNPERVPSLRRDYTDAQISASHVELVVDVLMETDPRFERVDLGYRSGFEHRRAYRRIG